MPLGSRPHPCTGACQLLPEFSIQRQPGAAQRHASGLQIWSGLAALKKSQSQQTLPGGVQLQRAFAEQMLRAIDCPHASKGCLHHFRPILHACSETGFCGSSQSSNSTLAGRSCEVQVGTGKSVLTTAPCLHGSGFVSYLYRREREIQIQEPLGMNCAPLSREGCGGISTRQMSVKVLLVLGLDSKADDNSSIPIKKHMALE